jgi:hypothetical protein
MPPSERAGGVEGLTESCQPSYEDITRIVLDPQIAQVAPDHLDPLCHVVEPCERRFAAE